MRFLLDTHVFLWYFMVPEKIPKKTLRLIEHPNSAVWVSTISLWEIAFKHSLGKLKLKGLSPERLIAAAKEQDFNTITISESDATEFGSVPTHIHSDPFDRMLVWQAINRKLTFVSAENNLTEYKPLGLDFIW